MKDDQKKNDLSRRDFMKVAGVTTAELAAVSLVGKKTANASPIARPAQAKIIGANDRINYGFIGVGGMGTGHLQIITTLASPTAPDAKPENLAVLAVCDVFEKRRQRAKGIAKLEDSQVFTDYRRVLENKDIDVVVIATPDHWHAPMAVEAMQAGKHIYLEKPMAHSIEEAFKIYDTAKRTNRFVQVGAHGTSDPKWHKSREIVRSGRMGKVLWAQGSYCRNNPKGEWNYEIEPEANEQTVDWRMWLGPAPKRAWSPERYFRWRKYWDYGNGIIGDLWPHRLHPLMLGMAIEEYPSSVSCIGGILCNSDNGNGEMRDVADTTMLTVQFPSGTMIFLAGSTVNERGVEDVIRGEKANLLFGGSRVELQPERPYVDEVEAKDETPPDSGESHLKHQKNFIESLRANVQPNGNVEEGVRVQAVVSLAEQSYRKGKTMHFDAARRKVRA
jgi:predicted dehydrogenase